MFILHLQNVIINCCIILSIIVILNPVTSETNKPQNEFTGNNENCVQQPTFNKKGSYSLEIKEGCDVYCVILDVENTSIINLITSIEYLEQDADLMKNASDLKSPFNIRLYELTKYFETNEEEKVLLEEWRKNADLLPYVKKYLSRSSRVFIEISGTGNWSHYEIKFSYEEIEYRLTKWTLKPGDGIQTIEYRPNSISLLRLYEPKMTWSGIEIWFDGNLQINTEMGEYILIGTGTEPFKNKHSRPLFVTEVKENSTFFVDSSSAFVAFVSGPIQKGKEHFKIIWKGIKEDIKDVPEDPMNVLNSSLICFYNYSVAKQEFDKGKEKGFETFRQMFKETAKAYLPEKYKTVDLNKLSVDLFGKPTNKTINGSVVLSILIKVMYGKNSIFTWRQLQNIIQKSEENSASILGYKVGKCPQTDQFELPYKDKEWSFVFYALVPVFGLFALMMWAWKQNLFAQNCLTEKEEKLTFDYTHAEPNAYVTTIPKVYSSDDEGRREILIQGSSQLEDTEGARDDIEMNVLPSTSQECDTLTHFLNSQSSKIRPSLKSLLDNVEEINGQSHSGKTEGNESDHLYDSVSSSKQLDETKL